jgi:hypothetical protein
MRSTGVILMVAFAALALAQTAQAHCTDDLAALQARVDREKKMNPPPPGAAEAAKVLQKFNDSESQDEIDCYNAVARARHALNTPPEAPAPLGQAQQPIGQPVAK